MAISLPIDKALSMALKTEIESANVYKKLGKTVKNFVMKEKFQFLIREEQKHRKIIETLFSKMFPGKAPSLSEKSLAPKLTLILEEETTVPELLELAMDAEKMFEEFYDELSEEVEERGAQEILRYLSTMEHGHYSLLKGEYDLCMRDEDYYQRDDFQYDMVHIGP